MPDGGPAIERAKFQSKTVRPPFISDGEEYRCCHFLKGCTGNHLPAYKRTVPCDKIIDIRSGEFSCYTLNSDVLSRAMVERETNPNFMNDVPELLILRLLAEQERYGYEIVQTMRSRTGDVVTTGELGISGAPRA